MAFDENRNILVINEGAYTVYLNDLNSPTASTRVINPKGRAMIPFKELRNALYSSPGNKEILSEYLTITDPDARRELDLEEVEIIDNAKIESMISITSGDKIERELVPFLKKLGPGEKERVAEVAIEKHISDIRILALLEQYTPYKSMIDHIRESVQEQYAMPQNDDYDEGF